MLIAVLADTHGNLPTRAAEAMRRADEIWHLGDYCDLGTLDAVRSIGRPFFGVLGNNDFGLDLPLRLTLERHGSQFHLIHILPSTVSCGGFLLHGHTHVPCDIMRDGTRLLNPGSIGKANKGAPASWAWMEIFEDGRITWSLERP